MLAAVRTLRRPSDLQTQIPLDFLETCAAEDGHAPMLEFLLGERPPPQAWLDQLLARSGSAEVSRVLLARGARPRSLNRMLSPIRRQYT